MKTVVDPLGVHHGLTEQTPAMRAVGIRPPCQCGAWIHLEAIVDDQWRYVCGSGVRFLEDRRTGEMACIGTTWEGEQPQYPASHPAGGRVW